MKFILGGNYVIFYQGLFVIAFFPLPYRDKHESNILQNSILHQSKMLQICTVIFYGMFARHLVEFVGGNYVIFLPELVMNAFFFCRMDPQILTKFIQNACPRGAGVPLTGS